MFQGKTVKNLLAFFSAYAGCFLLAALFPIVVRADGTANNTPGEKFDLGSSHTCAVTSSGGLRCWGYNANYQIGNNSTVNAMIPTDVTGLTSNMDSVAAGDAFTCAVTTSGGVKCWGNNRYGQMGNGSYNTADVATPTDVPGLTSGVVSIVAGYYHACALMDTGGVKCWGYNFSGQAGTGSTDSYITSATDVSGLTSGVVALTAGLQHTCALTSTGGMKCWGMNSAGQLGINSTTNSRVPADVNGLTSGVIAITAGYEHTCALTSGGGAKCWGYNSDGQLGNGSSGTNVLAPADVPGLTSGVSGIAAGKSHTCVSLSAGGAECWGYNYYGQVGNGAYDASNDVLSPVNVVNLTDNIVAISAGGLHTCILNDAGALKCWGSDTNSQVGIGGSGNNILIPVAINGTNARFSSLDSGTNFTCGVTTDNAAMCWGKNDSGQSGTGSGASYIYIPTYVSGLTSGVQAVATGGNFACALTMAGGVKCWGNNDYGQVGNTGSGTVVYTPADVQGLTSGVTAIAAGNNHVCALTAAGGVKCWGYGSSYQLGNNSTSNSVVPVDVVGLSSGVTKISLGYYFSCALTTAGGVKCWGQNTYGAIGNNTSGNNAPSPTDASGLTSGVIDMDAGGYYTCAVTTGGGAKCWGYNNNSQLGNNSTTNKLVPTDVTGLTSGVSKITAGGSTTCVITTTNGAKCWGYNTYAQVGDFTVGTNRPTAVDVYNHTSGVSSIVSGLMNQTCDIRSGGIAECWGDSTYGQLGIGRGYSFQLYPITVIPAGQAYTPNSAPSAPINLYANNNSAQSGQSSPVYKLTDTTPAFSAVYMDTNSADTAVYYQLQVATDTGFTSFVWDSAKQAITACLVAARCADITYAGSTLTSGNTYYWRIKYWDNSGAEGVWSATASFTLNSAPQISSILVNSGSDINLTAGATTTVNITAVITDLDGYGDINTYSGKFYRSGGSNAENCTADPLSCYSVPEYSCTLSDCSGNACNLTCHTYMQYFADATDSGTYSAEYWRSSLTVTDQQGVTATGYSPAGAPEVSSLMAMTLDRSTLSYGTIGMGSNSGSTNQQVVIENKGNIQLDLEASGSSLCQDYPTCSGSYAQISPSQQKYALAKFNYSSAGTVLGASATRVEVNLNKAASISSPALAALYFGIAIPEGLSMNQTYSGIVSISALTGN